MATPVQIDPLDAQRRRARFRAWHRGTQEMDLILGRFADARIANLSPAELKEFETLLEAPDTDLFAWIVGNVPVNSEYDCPLLHAIIAFHGAGR